VDLDSTICEVHGYQKQGAAYGYTKVRGYHPLLATRADTGEVVHARLRRGNANTARGIVRFIDELLARIGRAGAGEAVIVRADSGFFQHKLLDRLSRAGVGFSVTIPQRAPVRAAIDAIPEQAWQRIDYPDGDAHVAECLYRGRRLIVRRVPGHHGTQGQLFTTWRYHAFVTNLAGASLGPRPLPPRPCRTLYLSDRRMPLGVAAGQSEETIERGGVGRYVDDGAK
jgi:hypothetical protein